jgi:hypothetical protein
MPCDDALVEAAEFDVALVRKQLQQSPSSRSLLSSSASSPSLRASSSVSRGLGALATDQTTVSRSPAYVKSTFNHVLDARRPATSPLSIASLPGYGFQTPKATTAVSRRRTPFVDTTPIAQPTMSFVSSSGDAPLGTTTIEPTGGADAGITTTSEPLPELTLILPAERGNRSQPAPASSGRTSNNLVHICSQSINIPLRSDNL